ncbi:hypothetical protein AB0127_27200, partial [Klebsiella pneumoniae]
RAAREGDLGVVEIAIAAAPDAGDVPAIAGGVRAVDVVTAPAGVRGILSGVVIVDDLAAAEAARPALDAAPAGTVLVTRDGAVLTVRTLRAGSGG